MSSPAGPSVEATCCAQRCASTAGAGSARRAVAAELIEPVNRDRRCRRRGRARSGWRRCRPPLACPQPMRVHDHARQPRRQRQRAETFALRGNPAVVIERAEFIEQRLRLPSAPAPAADRETPAWRDRGRPIARDRAPARKDRLRGFRAGCRRRARRSAARPTAGSRRRARCGRRGRGAGRPRRARRARSPAGSGRYQARSAAPAPDRNRRQCERPRWSARFPAIEVASTTLRLAFRRRRDGAVLHGGIERAEQRHDLDARVMNPLSRENSACGGFRRRPAETPAPSRDRRAARSAIASAICRSIGASALRPR